MAIKSFKCAETTFIETRLFTRLIGDHLTDDEYAEVQVKIRDGVIWMLTIYAKSEVETIAPHVLQRIRREIDG